MKEGQGVKLTKAQRAMLFDIGHHAGPELLDAVARWKVCVTRPRFLSLGCLERAGLVATEYGVLGSPPYLRLTPAGRAALEQPQ